MFHTKDDANLSEQEANSIFNRTDQVTVLTSQRKGIFSSYDSRVTSLAKGFSKITSLS